MEHARGRAGSFGIGLHDAAFSAPPLDGDVFVDEDTGLGMDGIGDLDDGAIRYVGIVNGGLDGREIAAGRAYGVRGGLRRWRRRDRNGSSGRWGRCICGRDGGSG